MDEEHSYTIKAVARRTGLSTHVIRAWEKRYRAIKPSRTSTNRRLYSEKEVQRLELLRRATLAGHSIGTVANLATDRLAELVSTSEKAQTIVGSPDEKSGDLTTSERVSACIDAITHLDSARLNNLLMDSSLAFSQPTVIDQVIVPLILKIGDLWRDGALRIVHEHLASSVLRTFLVNMRTGIDIPVTAPRMVVTTPSGQLHELGALIVSAVAAAEGWQVTYLGPNLPAEEIGAAVEHNHARVLALSIVYPAEDIRLVQELTKLGRYIKKGTSIIVGGRAASSYDQILNQISAIMINDLHALRPKLESL